MAKYRPFFSVTVYSFLLGGLPFSKFMAVAAAGTENEGNSATTVRCRTGWVGNSETVIQKEWINDGYCDCPFEGIDEPDTNACSGSLSWAGVDTVNSDSSTTESKFVCPQQPNLILPLSRLQDGICDCCDGSDEDPRHDASHTKQRNPCIDNCDVILKVERERQAKIQKDFLVGSSKRERDISHFAKLRTAKIAEASDLEKKMAATRAEIDDVEGIQISGLKEAYVATRMATMKDLVTGGPMATALLSGLEHEELEALLIHVCQIAGEIAKSGRRDDNESTCLPLRVAALDLGLTWSDPEDYEGGTTKTAFHNVSAAQIVQIVFQNAAEEGWPPLRWKKSPPRKKNERRRLDEIDDDGMMYDDDYSMNDDSYRDDFYVDEFDEETSATSEKKASILKRNKFIDEVRASLFSTTRMTFLKESKEILDEIDKILAKDEIGEDNSSESDNSESDNGELKEDGDGAKNTTIDSSSVNRIREKRDIVETGFRWGASAKFLLGASSLPSRRKTVERLLIGTIFYGQIGTLHVWQILQAVLPEYKVVIQEFNRQAETTCASPWAGSCPPKHLYREPPEGSGIVPDFIEYPPPFILKTAAAFCDEESSNIGKRGDIACWTNDSDRKIEDYIAALASPQSSEGYEVPMRRNDDVDPFISMYDPISKLPVDTEGLRSLEDKRDSKETEHGNLQNTLKRLWNDIGGKDGNALGRGGEFHAITDQCFEVVAGKYTYELCMFGNANQKDGKSKTQLGKFEKIEYLEEDGINTRVLKWTNGAKCWNGPKRSATVHMTCGPDHKLLSANEPDTCRYVFEMESYLACDDAYKLKMGL